MQVLADVNLDYTLSLGNCINSVEWDDEGKALSIA